MLLTLFLGSGAIGAGNNIAKRGMAMRNGGQAKQITVPAKTDTPQPELKSIPLSTPYDGMNSPEYQSYENWKRTKQPKPEEKAPEPLDKQPKRKIEFSEPEWNNEESWFATNLERDSDKSAEVSRILPRDVNCLWVRMRNAKAISIQLFNENRNLIQIDMSSDTDEDNDAETTRIEMFDKTSRRFAPGIYRIRIRATVTRRGIGSDGERDPEQEKLLTFRLL